MGILSSVFLVIKRELTRYPTGKSWMFAQPGICIVE